MNKLDIIIPYYNKKDYIDRAIDSIFKQKNLNLLGKVIIVNDGSDSENTKYLNKFKGEKVLIVNKRHNEGLFHARTSGMKKSDAEYFCFLDADDEFSDTAFETFEPWVSSDNESILYFEMISVFKNGVLDDDRDEGIEDYWDFRDMIEEYVHFDHSMCNKIYPKSTRVKLLSIMNKIHLPTDVKLNFMEDVLWCALLISQNSSFAYTPEIAYKYHRENDDSIMNGVRDYTPFELYYSFLKPTKIFDDTITHFLEFELKRAKGE